jgi:hypothetical protein
MFKIQEPKKLNFNILKVLLSFKKGPLSPERVRDVAILHILPSKLYFSAFHNAVPIRKTCVHFHHVLGRF